MSIVARHKRLTTAILIFGALIALVVIFLSFFNWNLARPALARAITSKTGRATSIDGDLKVHWWSWTPSAQINGVTVSNPPWADRDRMFAAKRITLSISVGHLLRGQLVIPEITLVEPVINLERDSSGRASWELGNAVGKPNGNTAPLKIPAIRRLVIQNGHLHVLDEIRHLRFGGSIVADERSGDNSASAFKIAAKGSLNEKPFGLDASGGPLLDLTPDKPYSFSLHVTASDINLEAQVSVLKPFNLGLLDVKFAVSGKDLADVYYLTGLALPNTPHYRLAALLHVSGTTITADDLSGHLGTSDISGTIAVQTAGARPKLTAKLNSKTLNIVDLAPTLGHPEVKPQSLSSTDTRSSSSKNRRDTPANAAGTDRFLPDADLQVNRVRGMDADVTYRARAVTAPKVPMKEVSFHLVLDNGLLNLDPLSFVLDHGKFFGNIQINARNDIPESSIDMHIEDMDLGQFKPATLKDAPLAGPLIGRMKIHGFGHSVHKLAASADGSISFLIPHGEINQALAELTGINVTRGLGLLLAKNETKTAIRCGVIDFQAEKGDLSSKTLFIDTEEVLIKGRGGVKLDSETIHLAVEGDPKKLRFTRVRSPITVDGTLSHPAVGLDAGKLAKQGAVATALGTLLTPAAALIAFIDPGRAKDKDCVASSSEVSESVQNN